MHLMSIYTEQLCPAHPEAAWFSSQLSPSSQRIRLKISRSLQQVAFFCYLIWEQRPHVALTQGNKEATWKYLWLNGMVKQPLVLLYETCSDKQDRHSGRRNTSALYLLRLLSHRREHTSQFLFWSVFFFLPLKQDHFFPCSFQMDPLFRSMIWEQNKQS